MPYRMWSRRARRLVAGLAAIGLLVLGLAVWDIGPWIGSRQAHVVGHSSPYRNTGPGVKYVGDETCAACHKDITASYSQHSMGRSMALAADAPVPGLEKGGQIRFTAQGLEYAVEQRNGRMRHSETRHDADGKVLARAEATVTYAVGSGHRGRSYLIERDGFLVQSPISWYSQQRRWDLSPDSLVKNSHFERPIDSSCVFCHANRVEPRQGTINAYQKPTFRGLAIGCERCHGPGELHVKEPGFDSSGIDPTIVNPARLEPVLREAVCAQCHLAGRSRVERLGRTASDYRPGLPLGDFLAIFVEAEPAGDGNRSVGHVEQMHSSRCFQASEGRLGCISCHDAHRLPSAEERAGYYRQRCLACHESSNACSLPEPRRRERSRDGSCIACHMPRSPLSNVAHTAETDHGIPRWAESDRLPPIIPARRAPDQVPLVPADVALFGATNPESYDRELGIALAGYAADQESDRARLARLALERIEASLKTRPDDLPVLQARIIALTLRGQSREARAAAEAALSLAPDDERTLALVLPYLAGVDQLDEAIARARRLVAINPHVSRYALLLAKLQAQKGSWREAAESSRAALQINPLDLTARYILIRSAFELGDRTLGRSEAETYLRFDLDEGTRQTVLKWLGTDR